MREIFKKSKVLDYIDYSSTTKKLLITRNPVGFENKEKKEVGYVGVYNEPKSSTDERGNVILEERGTISDSDFERTIIKLLKINDIEFIPGKIPVHMYKALPDRADEFSMWFIDHDTLNIKNKDIFKRRIMGLTS